MNIETTPQILLTRRQAAKALAISERTLFTLSKDGVIPYIKLGNSVRYRVSDIEQALDGLQSEPPARAGEALTEPASERRNG